MNHKEINKLMAGVLGETNLYDVRRELKVIQSDLSREDAEQYFSRYTEDGQAFNTYEYSITSALPREYSEDTGLALSAAKRIAEKSNEIFVLSYEDGEWKAAYGDYGNCAEYKGGNPAYCTCMAILQFMGKV